MWVWVCWSGARGGDRGDSLQTGQYGLVTGMLSGPESRESRFATRWAGPSRVLRPVDAQMYRKGGVARVFVPLRSLVGRGRGGVGARPPDKLPVVVSFRRVWGAHGVVWPLSHHLGGALRRRARRNVPETGVENVCKSVRARGFRVAAKWMAVVVSRYL